MSADSMDVLERPLRYLAVVCSLVIGLGWLLFAIDQTSRASQASAAEISGQQIREAVDPDPDVEAARERAHGKVHEAIDDANDVLLRPFTQVAASSPNEWVRRSVPAMLALITFGFGLGMLARYLAGR